MEDEFEIFDLCSSTSTTTAFTLMRNDNLLLLGGFSNYFFMCQAPPMVLAGLSSGISSLRRYARLKLAHWYMFSQGQVNSYDNRQVYHVAYWYAEETHWR